MNLSHVPVCKQFTHLFSVTFGCFVYALMVDYIYFKIRKFRIAYSLINCST